VSPIYNIGRGVASRHLNGITTYLSGARGLATHPLPRRRRDREWVAYRVAQYLSSNDLSIVYRVVQYLSNNNSLSIVYRVLQYLSNNNSLSIVYRVVQYLFNNNSLSIVHRVVQYLSNNSLSIV